MAGDTSRIAKRDTPYDFPSYTADEGQFPYRPIVALDVVGGRSVAIVVTRERDCEYRALLADFKSGGPVNLWKPTKAEQVKRHRRRAIEFMWALQRVRGQGVVDRLLESLTEYLKQPLDQLAQSTPFTQSAVDFWRKRGITQFYLT